MPISLDKYIKLICKENPDREEQLKNTLQVEVTTS